MMVKVQVMIAQWPSDPVWPEKQLQAELAKTEGCEVAKVFAISLALDVISMDKVGGIAAKAF